VVKEVFKRYSVATMSTLRFQRIKSSNISLRCRYRHDRRRRKVLCILALILSGDVETNPGPTFCDTCKKPMFTFHILKSCVNCGRNYHWNCVPIGASLNRNSVFHCEHCRYPSKPIASKFLMYYRKRRYTDSEMLSTQISCAKRENHDCIWQEHSYSRPHRIQVRLLYSCII
jgi:hypothetical protein